MPIGSLPRSSGRECWVFGAAGPEDLVGVHGDFIAASLPPQEPLDYLAYFPIWDAAVTPFGHRAAPGSHALAVTRERFLLSRNQHRKGVPPDVYEVPFAGVLAVEWGDSLLSGWGAVHHAAGDGQAVLAWMYRATGGRHHLAAALRAHRAAAWRPAAPPPPDAPESPAAQGLAEAPPPLIERALPLLVAGERVLGLVRTRELWSRRRRRPAGRAACLSPDGLLIAAEGGLLVAERVAEERRSPLAGGVRCLALPWDRITELRAAPAGGAADPDGQHEGLLLRARRGTAAMERWFAIPEGGGSERECFLAIIGGGRGVGGGSGNGGSAPGAQPSAGSGARSQAWPPVATRQP